MGKVVRFTGSKLLGEELRRLRAGRSLSDIVDLGRSQLVPAGLRSIAQGTLSDIENGRSLPTLESVLALSVLYQVPTSRFVHILLEENLLAGGDSGDVAPEELTSRFAEAIHSQDWSAALSLAMRGMRSASPGWPSLRWRLNRALAIERMGLRGDAISELQACLDDVALPRSERFRVHHALSRAHSAGGQFSLAQLHLDASIAEAPSDVGNIEKCRLLQSGISLTLRRMQWGAIPSEEQLDTIEGWISQALQLAPADAISDVLGLRLSRGCVARVRERTREARREFRSVEAEARRLGVRQREIEALRNLAELDEGRDTAAALACHSKAAELAVAGNDVELAFLSYFSLGELASSPEQRAHYLRKCRRLYPLVRSTHPSVARFEATNREERS